MHFAFGGNSASMLKIGVSGRSFLGVIGGFLAPVLSLKADLPAFGVGVGDGDGEPSESESDEEMWSFFLDFFDDDDKLVVLPLESEKKPFPPFSAMAKTLGLTGRKRRE